MIDYTAVLAEIHADVQDSYGKGKVADYIPALAGVNPRKFGMAVKLVTGEEYTIGDAAEPFSMQSMSKVLMLTLAMELVGDKLWERVGREPSGNPFNSLVQLEHEHGKPRNPFINAGAFVVTDIVLEHTPDALGLFLATAQALSANAAVTVNAVVAASEKATGYRNAALANFMRSYGNIRSDVESVLALYCNQCALELSCVDTARMYGYLANEGKVIGSKAAVISKRQAKRVNALMLTCGLYDAVGDFAYRVGMPAKSGVGGGIVAVIPRKLIACVWSPELDKHGNSLLGTRALELFTTKTGLSIF